VHNDDGNMLKTFQLNLVYLSRDMDKNSLSYKPTRYRKTPTGLATSNFKGDPKVKEAPPELSNSFRIISSTIQHLHIKINSIVACMSLQQPLGRYKYSIFLTSSLEHIIVRNLLSMHER